MDYEFLARVSGDRNCELLARVSYTFARFFFFCNLILFGVTVITFDPVVVVLRRKFSM